MVLLEQASAALAGITVVLVAVLVLRRLRLAHHEAQRATIEAKLLPLALDLLDGEGEDGVALDSRELRILAAVLARYARELRGAPRERIAAFFERRGLVQGELASLRSRSAWRRAEAAHVLGAMSSPIAVPGLIAALEDPERDVRASAARSLGFLGAESAVEPLVRVLAHGRVPQAIAAHALLALGSPALPALRRLASGVEHEVRAASVELIGLIGDPYDAPTLERRLRDASAEVRAKAAVGLGRIGAAAAAPSLRAALGDRVPFVRAAAAEAIGVLGDVDAIGRLAQLATEASFEPARAAARALVALDPEAVLASPEAAPHLREASELAALKAA